ncbi:septum formation initiator family protein [bacterium]|nr:septum formation initiator family protein [bacterium]
MPRLTRCPEVEPAPRALTPAVIVRTLSLLAVVLGLVLMHLHLRFSLNELRAQIIGQQAQEERLLNEIKVLESKTEALKQRDRLLAYASSQLGMVKLEPGQRQALRLDHEIATRYAMARATGSMPASEDAGEADRIWIEALGQRLGLVAEAHARTN